MSGNGHRLTSVHWRRLLTLMMPLPGNLMGRMKIVSIPHVRTLRFAPTLAIGSLSVLLAAGLGALGILDRINLWVVQVVAGKSPGVFAKSLPPWVIWLATVCFACGIAASLLGISNTLRRLMVWVTTMVLIGGWAVVLVLAARIPEIGAPLVATLWAGFCAMIYLNHRPPTTARAVRGRPPSENHE